jgi:hypothetical protein
MRILPRDIPVVRGIRRTRPVPRRDMSSPEPKPCKHFSKRIPLNERFLKHLPGCSACGAVILYLEKQSQIDRHVYRNRN